MLVVWDDLKISTKRWILNTNEFWIFPLKFGNLANLGLLLPLMPHLHIKWFVDKWCGELSSKNKISWHETTSNGISLLSSNHRFLNTLDTTHSNVDQQQTGWNTPQGFMLYLSTNFETRYLLSSCSNQSIDKNFQFSPKFMLKVASSVFRNRCFKHLISYCLCVWYAFIFDSYGAKPGSL